MRSVVRMGLVALFFLTISVACTWGVWEEPSSLLLLPPDAAESPSVGVLDQWMVLSTVTSNARRALREPLSFREGDACHPFPRSYTLGEHMWNEGLLTALPLALTGDPIFAYNVMLLLLYFGTGVAMFAFVFDRTGSVPAGLLAGLLLTVYPARLIDPAHPFIYANLWTPPALLFLYRLFEDGDWRSAAGLAFFGALQLGESFYATLSAGILIGTSFLFLCIERRDVLVSRLPKLAICVLLGAGVGWWIYGPYLETAETWGVLGGRAPLGWLPQSLAFGKQNFPGIFLLALAALGLVDRLRPTANTKHGKSDPRVALLVAGGLVLWLSLSHIPLPFSRSEIPSLTLLLRDVIPGMSAVRAASAIWSGAYFALAVIAGYGAWMLTRSRSQTTSAALVVAITLGVLGETVAGGGSEVSFGRRNTPSVQPAGWDEPDRDFLRRLEGKTVVNVPVVPQSIAVQAHYLRAAAEHGGKTAACYNSFKSPLLEDVARIASSLPADSAKLALRALGFDVVVAHSFDTGRPRARDEKEDASLGAKLPVLDRSPTMTAFDLGPPRQTTSKWWVLGAAWSMPPFRTTLTEDEIPFVLRNPAKRTFVHPEPIRPSEVIIEWRDAQSNLVLRSEASTVLPIAIGPGARVRRPIPTRIPSEPGSYRVSLTLRDHPDKPVGGRRVIVGAPESS